MLFKEILLYSIFLVDKYSSNIVLGIVNKTSKKVIANLFLCLSLCYQIKVKSNLN